MRQQGSRSGFALLLVLMLVVLASTMLAGLARYSLTRALESQESMEEVQRRWAVASLQATVLEHAEDLLDEAEHGQPLDGQPPDIYANKPIAELRVTCRLDQIDYELVLTDEQAKLNVNTLLQKMTPGEARSVVSRLVAQAAQGQTDAVVLRPLTVGANTPKEVLRLPKVGGYGQVFQGLFPERLVGSAPSEGAVASVTCWGDGKVNLRRAPAKVVEQACTMHLGRDVSNALLAARDRDPYAKLSALLAQLDKVDAARKNKISQCVTDQSQCHGLWIIVHGAQRSWYTLSIDPEGGTGSAPPGDNAAARQAGQRYQYSW